jgi:hypothetical protein
VDATRDDVVVAPVSVAPADPRGVPSIAFASDWSLAAALNGTSLIVWDPRSGAKLSETAGFSFGYGNTVLGVAGPTVAVNQYLVHVFPGELYVARLYDAPTGVQLREFDPYYGSRPLLLAADGSRAYTLEPPDVIAWCR